jgi:hypothetical protein
MKMFYKVALVFIPFHGSAQWPQTNSIMNLEAVSIFSMPISFDEVASNLLHV